jgi:hypothetical protein
MQPPISSFHEADINFARTRLLPLAVGMALMLRNLIPTQTGCWRDR